jgi:hypothetical protein
MLVPVTVKLLPLLTTRPLPPASCRLATDPPPLRVTVLVPSMMQAFVEAVGLPPFQFPGMLQSPLPSVQVVEGAPKLPHWACVVPAAKDRDSTIIRESMGQDAIENGRRGRTTRLPVAAKAEFCTDPSSTFKRQNREPEGILS